MKLRFKSHLLQRVRSQIGRVANRNIYLYSITFSSVNQLKEVKLIDNVNVLKEKYLLFNIICYAIDNSSTVSLVTDSNNVTIPSMGVTLEMTSGVQI